MKYHIKRPKYAYVGRGREAWIFHKLRAEERLARKKGLVEIKSQKAKSIPHKQKFKPSKKYKKIINILQNRSVSL